MSAGVACSLRDHIHFDRRQPASAHLAHLYARTNVQRGRSVSEHAEGNASIHQRAQHHVAADPGKALQIADSHCSVILNERHNRRVIFRAGSDPARWPAQDGDARSEEGSVPLAGVRQNTQAVVVT